jgi:hypothetical protein
MYFICQPRHAFLMARLYRACSLGICFSGSKPPTPTRSQHPSLPALPHAYSNQPICFLCEPRHNLSMANQYRVRSLCISVSGSNTPALPHLSISASTAPTGTSEPTCILPLQPLSHKWSGKAVLSPCARYLHLGVKKAHPCVISASWPPTSATHIIKPIYILPQRAPPCNFDGQAVPSAFARYLLVTTTSPPISASVLPTAPTLRLCL